MNALLEDQSSVAIARASVTYNMVIEGVLAETGYHSYHRSLAMNDLMPGLCTGLVNIKRDESRHIAYGVYLLSRLVAEDEAVWPAIEERMMELRPLIDEIIRAPYAGYSARSAIRWTSSPSSRPTSSASATTGSPGRARAAWPISRPRASPRTSRTC